MYGRYNIIKLSFSCQAKNATIAVLKKAKDVYTKMVSATTLSCKGNEDKDALRKVIMKVQGKQSQINEVISNIYLCTKPSLREAVFVQRLLCTQKGRQVPSRIRIIVRKPISQIR